MFRTRISSTLAVVFMILITFACNQGQKPEKKAIREPGGGVAAFVADWRDPNFNTKVIPYMWPYGTTSPYRMGERSATIPGVIVDPIFLDEDIVFSSMSHFFYGGNNSGMSGDRTSLTRQHCRKPYGLFLQFGADPSENW